MLRITPINNCTSVTLKLEGSLREPFIAELTSAIESARVRASDVRLDLSSVTFVDLAGAGVLRDLVAQEGIAIVASSAFVSELLHMEELR